MYYKKLTNLVYKKKKSCVYLLDNFFPIFNNFSVLLL